MTIQLAEVSELLERLKALQAEGHRTSACDDPWNRRIGFTDQTAGHDYVVGLSALKRDFLGLSRELQESLPTVEGRKRLFGSESVGSL